MLYTVRIQYHCRNSYLHKSYLIFEREKCYSKNTNNYNSRFSYNYMDIHHTEITYNTYPLKKISRFPVNITSFLNYLCSFPPFKELSRLRNVLIRGALLRYNAFAHLRCERAADPLFGTTLFRHIYRWVYICVISFALFSIRQFFVTFAVAP